MAVCESISAVGPQADAIRESSWIMNPYKKFGTHPKPVPQGITEKAPDKPPKKKAVESEKDGDGETEVCGLPPDLKI